MTLVSSQEGRIRMRWWIRELTSNRSCGSYLEMVLAWADRHGTENGRAKGKNALFALLLALGRMAGTRRNSSVCLAGRQLPSVEPALLGWGCRQW